MNETAITAGQSLLDVAIQELGTVEALFDLAAANGLGVTDALVAGQTLAVPVASASVLTVAQYFGQRDFRINTGDAPSRVPSVRHDFDGFDFDDSDWDVSLALVAPTATGGGGTSSGGTTAPAPAPNTGGGTTTGGGTPAPTTSNEGIRNFTVTAPNEGVSNFTATAS